jgi:hypothetical protein
MGKISFDAANTSGPQPFNVSEPDAAIWIPKDKFREENLAREYRITAVKSVHFDGNTRTADTARVFYKLVLKDPVVKKLRKRAKAVKEQVKAETLRSIKKQFRRKS